MPSSDTMRCVITPPLERWLSFFHPGAAHSLGAQQISEAQLEIGADGAGRAVLHFPTLPPDTPGFDRQVAVDHAVLVLDAPPDLLETSQRPLYAPATVKHQDLADAGDQEPDCDFYIDPLLLHRHGHEVGVHAHKRRARVRPVRREAFMVELAFDDGLAVAYDIDYLAASPMIIWKEDKTEQHPEAPRLKGVAEELPDPRETPFACTLERAHQCLEGAVGALHTKLNTVYMVMMSLPCPAALKQHLKAVWDAADMQFHVAQAGGLQALWKAERSMPQEQVAPLRQLLDLPPATVPFENDEQYLAGSWQAMQATVRAYAHLAAVLTGERHDDQPAQAGADVEGDGATGAATGDAAAAGGEREAEGPAAGPADAADDAPGGGGSGPG